MGIAVQSGKISETFAICREQNRAALMPFATAGYPTLDFSADLVVALAESGADLIEIGVPFSDPLADGATVQHSSQVALDQGVTLEACLDLASIVRQRGVTIPLLLMGYTNPFFQYGFEKLAVDSVEHGVDGFIIPDLPLEESEPVQSALQKAGLDLVFMLAPTSTSARIKKVAEAASGFIYCVSLTGVTGAREQLAEDLPSYLDRIRQETDLPLAVGFGIATPDHVRQTAAVADGVIVASALIDLIDATPPENRLQAASTFIEAMSTATKRDFG